jgi:DNA-binding MarR family transcriptional regulator
MDMKLILNGIYSRLNKREAVPIKREYVTTVLREMESRGLEVKTQDRHDGRVDFLIIKKQGDTNDKI